MNGLNGYVTHALRKPTNKKRLSSRPIKAPP